MFSDYRAAMFSHGFSVDFSYASRNGKNSVNCQKTGIRSNQANAGLNIATNNKAILINDLKNAVA